MAEVTARAPIDDPVRQPERTQTTIRARALVLTGHDETVARHTRLPLATEIASLQSRPANVVGYPVRAAQARAAP